MIGVGAMGYSRMGVDLMPDFDVPVVSVVTTYVGADPEVMDQDVVDIIEEQVGTLEGIESIRSTSYDSYATTIIEFNLKRNIDVCTQEVRDKVNAATDDLPKNIEVPIVQKIDPDAQAIMYLGLYGDVPYAQLSQIADDVLQPRIQNINGVGKVDLNGFQERTARIWLNIDKMEKYDIGPAQVLAALSNWHIELPGGRTESDTLEATVKIYGEYQSCEELEKLIVDWKDGAPVRLRQIARVEDGLEDKRSISRLDGHPSIMLAVCKQSGTNTVGVADSVLEKISELNAVLPEGVHLVRIFDTSRFIRDSVQGVADDLMLGALITVFVIYVFLRSFKMTLVSLVAIPTSLLAAFGAMYFMDFTVNTITMLAMSLCVGMVIDDAIVVSENVFRHMEQEQLDDAKVAAERGTGEVAFAVFASTIAIAAIFLPVAFMGGIIGRIFYQFGLAVGIAIAFSYCVSITITPMLCGLLLERSTHESFVARMLGSMFNALDRFYYWSLEICLRNRLTRVFTILVAIGCFVAGIGFASQVGTEFAPNSDRGQFLINAQSEIGTSLTLSNERCLQIEAILAKHPEIEHYGTIVGMSTTNESYRIISFVEMHLKKDRPGISQQDCMDALREELAVIPGLRVYISHLQMQGGQSTERSAQVAYVLQGPDLNTLQKIAHDLEDWLREHKETYVDIDDDLELTKPQVAVYPRREAAADMGVTTSQISTALQVMMSGVDAARIKLGSKRYDVRVKASDDFRVDADSINKIIIRNQYGKRVRLGTMVDIKENLGPNKIKRYNRARSIMVRTDVVRGVPVGNASDMMAAKAQELVKQYVGYSVAPSGMTKIQTESMQYLSFALMSSIVIIYFVLAAQFESFIHPLTIMMTLPLAMAGVFVALYFTGVTLSIFSFIGMIMLVGIVTRNGILLVEFANQQRERGLNAHHAMLEAGHTRLRPILMTAVSTIGGVVPIALALSEGGEMRQGMGIAVMGGMLSSTMLTLYVIPTAYITFEGISRNIMYCIHKVMGHNPLTPHEEDALREREAQERMAREAQERAAKEVQNHENH